MEDLIDSILRGVRIVPKCGKENNQHEKFSKTNFGCGMILKGKFEAILLTGRILFGI